MARMIPAGTLAVYTASAHLDPRATGKLLFPVAARLAVLRIPASRDADMDQRWHA